jgi:26S proteasome regulatory subunit N1
MIMKCFANKFSLGSCVNLHPPPDDVSFLRVAHKIYVQHSKFPEALRLSIHLGDPDLIREDFNAPGNPCVYLSLRLTLSLI